MKGRREKGNILGVEKCSAVETILLVNWQPANTLITKLLYGQEKNWQQNNLYSFWNALLAEQTLLLKRLLLLPLTFSTSSARSLGSHCEMQIWQQPHPSKPDKQLEQWTSPLPCSGLSRGHPKPSTKAHLFMNTGLPCQPHHSSHALGYRNRTTAAQAAWLLAGLWLMMMDFVIRQETHLLNHLLTTYDPDPRRLFTLSSRWQEWGPKYFQSLDLASEIKRSGPTFSCWALPNLRLVWKINCRTGASSQNVFFIHPR